MMRNLKADLELCKKATPGPWEIGVQYLTAKVNDGSDPNWKAPESIPKGKCCCCCDEATLVETFTSPEGYTIHLHRFESPEDWHEIYNTDGARIAGNYGYEEGGICSNKNDAEFITAAREGWPEAINRALAAEAKLESITKVLKLIAYQPCQHRHNSKVFGLCRESIKNSDCMAEYCLPCIAKAALKEVEDDA